MRKLYLFSLVLLSATVVLALADPRPAFSQRIRGGGSNQGSSDNKKDEDEQGDKKGRRGQGSQGQGSSTNNNQGNQGTNQGSQSNSSGTPRNASQNSGKSGNSTQPNNLNQKIPSRLQPFIQGGRPQNDNDRNDKDRNDKSFRDRDNDGENVQGQGGRFFNPGRDNNPGNNQNQGITIGPGGTNNADSGFRKVGRWQGNRWEGSRKADHWTEHFGGNQRLFSSQWYKDHPQAWKYNNDRSNVWVVATVPGIYSWLGWGSVPQQYAVGFGPSERFDASRYGDWYPLGVYSLMSGGEDMGTRVVQLAVDRHGHINGNYFDMITDDDKSISGNIDRQSQRVEFWLNRNPQVRFRTSVFQLLQQPYGSITVRLPGGDQRWQFVRLEN